MISTVLELAGFCCLVVAAWLWCPMVGLLAAGLVLIVVGLSAGGANLHFPRLRGRKEAG